MFARLSNEHNRSIDAVIGQVRLQGDLLEFFRMSLRHENVFRTM